MRIKALIQAAGSRLVSTRAHAGTANRVNVLGVGISAINIPMAIDAIERWIASRAREYVTVTGVHGVMECQRDEKLRQIHNTAGLVAPDGMPMVWISRWRGYHHVDRVYGPDLMAAVCELSPERGWRHFLYGGGEGVVERLRARMEASYPGILIVGTCTPPFRPLTCEEDVEVVELINRSEADVVWVGLSTPKQERWMADHLGRIAAPVMIGIGAAFDIHAGLKPEAPQWVQKSGFQWLFRLIVEPRRLWRRYFLNNPVFVLRFLQHELGIKRRSI